MPLAIRGNCSFLRHDSEKTNDHLCLLSYRVSMLKRKREREREREREGENIGIFRNIQALGYDLGDDFAGSCLIKESRGRDVEFR